MSTSAAAATVFISHAEEDKASARAICDLLEANGIACWIAPRDIQPGKSWAAAIVDAIESCRVLILLVTARSVASRQVAREVQLADAAGSAVLALRLEQVELAGDLEYFLSNTQWLDVLPGNLDERSQPLVAYVRALIAREPAVGKPVRPQRSGAAAELQHVVTTWFTTLTGGPKSVALVESWDGSTILFVLRYLLYMVIISTLIRLPLSEAGLRRPLLFVAASLIGDFVEVAGAVAVLHWSLRRAGGTGDLRGSVTAVCLHLATVWPMLAVTLAPANPLMVPLLDGLKSGTIDDMDVQAWFASLTAVDVLTIFACYIAATVAVWLAVRGLFQSLRIVHALGKRRTAAAFALAVPVFAIFAVVVSVPFTRAIRM